jgi:hypothetical protein
MREPKVNGGKEARVNVGVKVHPELKEALIKHAIREERTLSKLCEILLTWALQQAQRVDNSTNLKHFEIVDTKLLQDNGIRLPKEYSRDINLLQPERFENGETR